MAPIPLLGVLSVIHVAGGVINLTKHAASSALRVRHTNKIAYLILVDWTRSLQGAVFVLYVSYSMYIYPRGQIVKGVSGGRAARRVASWHLDGVPQEGCGVHRVKRVSRPFTIEWCCRQTMLDWMISHKSLLEGQIRRVLRDPSDGNERATMIVSVPRR